MRVRDRAEESVKLQQPEDKKLFSPSAGVCERGKKQRSRASRWRNESRLPAVTGAPGFPPISRPQTTNAKQDKTNSWTRMQKGSHS